MRRLVMNSWETVNIKHHRLGPMEFPDHSHDEHEIVITLTSSSRAELHTCGGGIDLSGFPPERSVGLIPAGQLHNARFAGESEFLSIYIAPSAVEHAAPDA